MKQDRKALVPADPPAPDAPEEGDVLDHPAFDNEAEEDAYWRGVNSGLRMGGESGVTIVGRAAGPLDPDAPIESRRVRRARWDGFTGPRSAAKRL